MGVDMYLDRRVWVQGNKDIQVLDLGSNVRLDKIKVIVEEAGYWCKANQIHNWFVQNCGGGEDNCQECYVSREQLAELRTLCKKVLRKKSLAEELLPASGGFFFGSTEYDKYYYEDLKETVKIIDEALACEGGDFYYQASW